ncbi:hypothetical protein QAO71_17470 (plasmid) [Halopseudomonas sp. SMJS2]|uniref:hypothetical protein n=1 Tax=Halopseudomonas sp. SMJS2 TaxID=3041098 RepID=UPI0024535615|nr:hypothetical protein [Halopseudomonas sp. SMJS2]WGK63559.1 hypothetical protein QAO71_17470 [Halopseudomonas sp. SMJS2]
MNSTNHASMAEITVVLAKNTNEGRINLRLQVLTCALVVCLLVVFGELGRRVWDLPGMVAGLLFTVSLCVAMTGSVMAMCMQIIINKRESDGTGVQRLQKAQNRLATLMLGLSVCFAFASVGAAKTLGFFPSVITIELPYLYNYALMMSFAALLVYLALLSSTATLMVMRYASKDGHTHE